ncbi:MAG: type I-C CRISPR-associated protein Cas5c [Clostridium sp.]
MEKENSIEFKVYGRRALFSDPITRVGGEKFSYQIPTYQALKGIAESIYWKPTFVWVIDSVRVMRRIQTETQGMRPIEYAGGNTLSIYTYLRDVEYQVRAHFEWNLNRPNLAGDRNENKHFFVAKRMLERGGRRDIFLGTRECQGYVEPCSMDEGEGAYDSTAELSFGLMVHGMTYPDEAVREEEKGMLTVRFWQPVMRHGVIEFIRPEECQIRRKVREMQMIEFGTHNFSGLEEFEREGGIQIGLDAGTV